MPYDSLSTYNFFAGEVADLIPNGKVLPYELATPLFSDYTYKARFIHIPDGINASYVPNEIFDFPIGTIIIKNFYYPYNFNNIAEGRQLLETRLLVHDYDGWQPYSYLWNDEQTEATFTLVGKQVNASWVHYDGSNRSNLYEIPNKNKCKNCHNINDALEPIGPKVENLNFNYTYADGVMNQLDKWREMGWLGDDTPSSGDLPAFAHWDDASTGTLDERARAYLDVNCGHCHRPEGEANNSGLFLYHQETDSTKFGICKPPVGTGQGSGTFNYAIVPGEPETSIMTYRMNSVELDVAMPEVSRSLIHEEGVTLIKDWIASLEGSCE